MSGSEIGELVRWVVPIILPAATGLFGVWIGAWLTTRRERDARRFDFIKRQIEEFYAPMVGIRSEVRAKSEVRVKVHEAAGAAWCDRAAGLAGDDLRRFEEAEWPQYERLMEYSNQQLRESLIPAYRTMVSLFREKGWLAEESTRTQFPRLAEFVEIWERFFGQALPRGVIERLGHSEKSVDPLYDDLTANLARLREGLRTGNVES